MFSRLSAPVATTLLVVIVFTVTVLASVSDWNPRGSGPIGFEQQARPGPQPALDELMSLRSLEPQWLKDLALDADQAAIGAYNAIGQTSASGWEMDLGDNVLLADRVALGLAQMSVAFERTSLGVIVGSGSLDVAVDQHKARTTKHIQARLAAIIELSGSPAGRLSRGSSALELGRQLGLAPTLVDGETWISSAADLAAVAKFEYLNVSRVPILGAGSAKGLLNERGIPASSQDLLGPSAQWTRAITGSLYPGAPLLPTSLEGGVGWNNREAQEYQPELVTIEIPAGGEPGSMVIETTQRVAPDSELLPFVSGMAISSQEFGWGTFSAELTLPQGAGLWPALWLLDAEACENPGRCSGYDSEQYHEIDIIETRGSEPDAVHLSVHWWDERLMSDSMLITASDTTQRLAVTLQRRPGLLVWSIDGEVVNVVSGPVEGFGKGPHRAAPMRLVVNTAVGGSFAGDRIVGSKGGWWGDAKVPAGFPQMEWDNAMLVVHSLKFEPLL